MLTNKYSNHANAFQGPTCDYFAAQKHWYRDTDSIICYVLGPFSSSQPINTVPVKSWQCRSMVSGFLCNEQLNVIWKWHILISIILGTTSLVKTAQSCGQIVFGQYSRRKKFCKNNIVYLEVNILLDFLIINLSQVVRDISLSCLKKFFFFFLQTCAR